MSLQKPVSVWCTAMDIQSNIKCLCKGQSVYLRVRYCWHGKGGSDICDEMTTFSEIDILPDINIKSTG